MAKHLVIVESPAKAKTINKYLGKNYLVKASMGHVRDLVKNKLGVDLENNFKPHYVNSRDKSKVIKELKETAQKCDSVILALDPDREGEAIAWHLRELLKKEVGNENHFSRVTYNQITKSAIEKAFADPGSLDMDKVNAQQARRVLDRLVGYQVSPLLWRRIRGGSSAGRVQTVALRLVCEREKEILGFTPEPYWIFKARVRKEVEPKEPFEITLHKIDGNKGEIFDRELAQDLLGDLEKCLLNVDSINVKEVKKRPQPPFITSTLQQAASSAYGFQPKRTMSLAQKLYEGVDLGGGEGPTGLITYMRTDSTYLAGEAVDRARECIRKSYGEEYLPAKPVFYRSKESAQEAHEAIRPTDPSRTPDTLRAVLGDAEWKLYSLIWRRMMACQMVPARIEQTTVDITTDSTVHNYIFRANASRIIFKGYMAAWGRGLEESENEEEESYLPPLKEGEPLEVLKWLREEKETQPPKRFSEAALIKELEKNGVGRPSTYATILTTLYNRDYIRREKRSLQPTEAGMEVNDFLVNRLPELFAVKFTARMEEELDEIEEGKVHWTEMMQQFYEQLEKWIAEAKALKIDRKELKTLLDLAAEIKNFKPPVKQGKKTYDDQAFTREIRDVFEQKGEITERQVEHLRRVIARYRGQINSLTDQRAEELNLTDLIAREAENNRPPDEKTWLKLNMLGKVEFAPAKKVGNKTYNDQKFVNSLRNQVEGGRRLSGNQEKHLERLIYKYARQIENFEQQAEKAGLSTELEEDHESGPLLEVLEEIKQFKEPSTRGKKTWDDAAFASSLKEQYTTKKSLTTRQRAALKKLLAKYHEQISGYEEKRKTLDLPPPGGGAGKGKTKKKKQ
ncbi:MAG: type I DNA topoisomerase [Bacillota bacterium]